MFYHFLACNLARKYWVIDRHSEGISEPYNMMTSSSLVDHSNGTPSGWFQHVWLLWSHFVHGVDSINLPMPLGCLPWSLSDRLKDLPEGSLFGHSLLFNCASSAAFCLTTSNPLPQKGRGVNLLCPMLRGACGSGRTPILFCSLSCLIVEEAQG
jgi:hypothetical protein